MRHFSFVLVLCFWGLRVGGVAEARPVSALRYRTDSTRTRSEALLGGFVQCQRESDRSGCHPGFELEQGVLKKLSLGFSSAFSSAGLFPSLSENLPKFILGLSGNYYGHGSFGGLWLQLSLRDKFYSTGGEGFSHTLAVAPMLGWRWMGEDHPSNFALSVGFEKNLSTPTSWLLLARVEVGLRFLWAEVFY